MSQAVIEQTIARWRGEGIQIRPGATAEDIIAVERLLGAQLPADARAFYEMADGMRDSDSDKCLLSVWSTKRIVSEKYEQQGRDELGAYRDVAFGDVMVNSWHFWFRVRDGGRVTVLVEAGWQEFKTLTLVLSRYLENPESLELVAVDSR
jgi:hypothetical protein